MGNTRSEVRNLDYGVFVARLDLLAGELCCSHWRFLPPLLFTKLNWRYEIKYSS